MQAQKVQQIEQVFGSLTARPTVVGTDSSSNLSVGSGKGAAARSKHTLRRWLGVTKRMEAKQISPRQGQHGRAAGPCGALRNPVHSDPDHLQGTDRDLPAGRGAARGGLRGSDRSGQGRRHGLCAQEDRGAGSRGRTRGLMSWAGLSPMWGAARHGRVQRAAVSLARPAGA